LRDEAPDRGLACERAYYLDGDTILQVEDIRDSSAETVDANHFDRFGGNEFGRDPDRIAGALNASKKQILRIEITADCAQIQRLRHRDHGRAARNDEQFFQTRQGLDDAVDDTDRELRL